MSLLLALALLTVAGVVLGVCGVALYRRMGSEGADDAPAAGRNEAARDQDFAPRPDEPGATP